MNIKHLQHIYIYIYITDFQCVTENHRFSPTAYITKLCASVHGFFASKSRIPAVSQSRDPEIPHSISQLNT